MSDQDSFRMSQGLEVLTPKADQAYPIPCGEWAVLKGRVSKLSSEPWLFNMIGSTLVGAALSTFLAIVLGAYASPDEERALVIAWAVVAVTLVAGALSLWFAHKERGVNRDRAEDIVTQMDLIEKRFDRRPAQASSPPPAQQSRSVADWLRGQQEGSAPPPKD